MREYKLIAHRGSHKFVKENSLFSFFNAINENYYGFEFIIVILYKNQVYVTKK